MIDILKRILVGIIVGMSIFFLKTQVFALETSSFQAYSSNQSGTLSLAVSNNNPRNYVNLTFNNNYTNTEGYDYIQFSVSATLFEAYQYNGATSTSGAFYHGVPMILGAYIVGNDTTAYCESTFSSIKCPIKKGSTYSRLTLYVSTVTNISPTATAGSIQYFVDQRIMIFSSEVKQGISDSTQEQTEEILDSDAPASATYDNDYTTDDYDSAEQSIHSTIDVDVSSLTFDANTWGGPFHYIWDLVTSFVQVNSKVFSMITGFLTFSFVGLVFNRS